MTHYHGPNYYRQSLTPVVIDPVERLIEAAVVNEPMAFAKSLIACDNKFDGVNAKAMPEHPANLAHNVVVTTRNALAKVLGDSDDCAWTAAEKAALFIDKACIDGEKQFGRKPEMPAYHDPTHYLTVALGAMATGLADHIYNKNGILTRPDVTDLFVAGLVHDFLNPGGSNRVDKDTYKLFAFERVTWESVKRLSSSSGYEGERLERMRTIVFATDPECGAPLAEMALDYHYSGNDPAKQANLKATAASHINKMSKQFETKEEKRQLQALYKDLFADRRTAEMAGFLTHNDIALSTLSVESYLKNTRKLDMEYKRVGKDMKLMLDENTVNVCAAKYFFENIAGLGRPCVQPTLERYLRAAGEKTMNAVLGVKAESQPVRLLSGTAPASTTLTL